MPKVTLYVKEADKPVWERAKFLAGDSLSAFVTRALAECCGHPSRLTIAVTLLQHMLGNGGTKSDKVRAAFEYADLLLEYEKGESNETDAGADQSRSITGN